MKMLLSILLFFMVAACASVDLINLPSNGNVDLITPPRTEVSEPDPDSQVEDPVPSENLHLDNFGPAPELDNQVWLNTEGTLRLEELRGQVVLLEMWTFG